MQTNGFPPTIIEICREFDFSSTNAATQFLLALERKGYIKRTAKGASRGLQLLDEQGNPIVLGIQSFQQMQSLNTSNSALVSPAVAVPRPLPETVKSILIIGEGTSLNPLSVFLSPQGQVKVDTEFFLPEASKDALATMSLFAAVVTDDGMSADGLRRGDLAVARQQFSAEEGDTVIVLAQETTLVRRLQSSLSSVLQGGAGNVGNVGSAGSTASMELVSTAGFPPIPYRGNDAALAIIGVVVGAMRRL